MNPSLAARLRLGFGVMLVLLVAVTVVGVGRLFQLRQDFEDANSRAFQLELAVERMRSAFILQQAALRGTRRDRAAARSAYDTAVSVLGDAEAAARTLARREGGSLRLLDEAAASARRWRSEVAAPILRGRAPPRERDTGLAREVIDADNALIERQQELRRALRNDVRDDTGGTLTWVLGALAAAFLAAVAVFSGLVNAMRAPLESLVQGARRLSGGDLRARVAVGGPGETATLGMAFNEMAGELEDTYRRVEEERHRLATMIESLGDGLIVLDGEDRVILTNPSARAMLPGARGGAPIEEAFGSLATEAGSLGDLLSGELAGELRIGDGERELAVLMSPLETRQGGAVLSVRDVSERVRIERMKDEFVATVSHELRSPLTSIKGFTELLAMTRDSLSPEQAKSVDIIERSTTRLIDLVNDLLDLARSDAGRLSIQPQPCEVVPLIEETAALMRPRLRERKQKLEIVVDEELPSLYAEPARVKQILTNLLTNAHLYSDERARIQITARQAGSGVELCVSDDGPGIPPSEREHLFERFWRGDAGESQEVGGSGLGLPIVKSLVELHGGEIDVESAAGSGTRVRLVLPAVDTGRLPGADALAGKRVLIVEDEPATAELLVERLGALGVEAQAAAGGPEALERLDSERFDLVVLDLRIGAAGSSDFLSALRSSPRHAGLPVTAVSIYAGREAHGGEREVAPPVDSEALIDAVVDSLAQRKRVVVGCRDPRRRARIAAAFAAQGLQPRLAESAEEALALARTLSFDLMLVDAQLPGAMALKIAVEGGAVQGPPPRVVLLDETDDRSRPPTVSLEELIEHALRALERVEPRQRERERL